jgi:hypothetical protein
VWNACLLVAVLSAGSFPQASSGSPAPAPKEQASEPPHAQGPDAAPPASGKASTQPRPAARGSRPAASIKLADTTPEHAFKTFVLAIIACDGTTLRAVTLPDKELDLLLRGQSRSPEAIKAITAHLDRQPMRRLKPADRLTLPRNRPFVVGAEEVAADRVMLLPHDTDLPTRLVKIGSHWKVDSRPMIAARKAVDAFQRKKAQQKPANTGR